jgi:hypothetical protein
MLVISDPPRVKMPSGSLMSAPTLNDAVYDAHVRVKTFHCRIARQVDVFTIVHPCFEI